MSHPKQNPLTPCKGVCDFDYAVDRCGTCGRTLKQIMDWPRLTTEERRAIIKLNRSRDSDG
jgi:predicted Fe-S protein YdhL (DUF1289 family)